ncbi:putative reverse transcriptase domain-containing protein [Tanacetum coccineum]
MIDQALLRNSTNGDGSHSSHGDNRRNVQTARPCFYADFMKCQPLNFKGAERVVVLLDLVEMGEIKKLEIELWNLKVKGNDVPAYTERFQELTLICTKFVANETEKVDKYLSGLPDNIYGNVKAAKPKTLDETIENTARNRMLLNSEGQLGSTPKGNGCFECGASGHFKRDCPKLKNKMEDMGQCTRMGFMQWE